MASAASPMSATGATSPTMEDKDDKYTDNEHSEDELEEDHEDDESLGLEKEWDEGGPSHCGYSEGVHDTLMTVGKSVHSVVGDPSNATRKDIKGVGNWFQEASYAVRDFFSGKNDTGLAEDSRDAISVLMGTKKEEEGEGDKTEETGAAATGETAVTAQS
mmetsp:Transcript_5090/g.7736  ORF Transcript_5090/g.7736 Transcript_5090/m.7736 type:complete len:160 (+) Transcript_5090:176-655(+)|eukprot:CAMPEP_0195261162 /NCGR_PEP_ID=MMETSP0706-20130129/8990_1 /TAXON_ID=33640 /ORGANISM="Asterionellopsis glacialis, Strain CCMP134" /LENGTH=159 /DNA_ID=CAMNT_0040314989 /DNA_START=70 /DNA_END=549 /DNA_ORIENTATION=-